MVRPAAAALQVAVRPAWSQVVRLAPLSPRLMRFQVLPAAARLLETPRLVARTSEATPSEALDSAAHRLGLRDSATSVSATRRLETRHSVRGLAAASADLAALAADSADLVAFAVASVGVAASAAGVAGLDLAGDGVGASVSAGVGVDGTTHSGMTRSGMEAGRVTATTRRIRTMDRRRARSLILRHMVRMTTTRARMVPVTIRTNTMSRSRIFKRKHNRKSQCSRTKIRIQTPATLPSPHQPSCST